VRAWTCKSTEGLWLGRDGTTFLFSEPDRLVSSAADAQATVVAPLAGMVRGVFVAEGDRVSKGMPLVAIEAMKMETVLTAKTAGVVRRVAARQGGLVAMRDVLVEIEPDPAG
jgi:biotin carboxyl carrier protein